MLQLADDGHVTRAARLASVETCGSVEPCRGDADRAPFGPHELIRTERGAGYVFTAAAEIAR
jgi:hypothetical protein